MTSFIIPCSVALTLMLIVLISRLAGKPLSPIEERAFLSLGIFLLASPLFYEYPPSNLSSEERSQDITFIQIQDNGIWQERPYGYFAWEWNTRRIEIPRHSSVTANISILTENPKVMEIHYEVSVHVEKPHWVFTSDEVTESRLISRFQTSREAIDSKVSYHLYDFNAKNSRWMGETLKNPLKREQQQVFEGKVLAWLQDRLPKGLKATKVRFWLG